MFLLAMLAPVAAVAPAPQPGALRTFGDWTVGCDNARSCQAVALVPDGEDRDAWLLLVLTRDAGGAAMAALRVPLDRVAPGTRAMLNVDGTPVAQLVAPDPAGGLALPLDGKLAAAIANGRAATLATADGKTVARASLAGLSAAMLYIDEQQRRIGTIGALRRPGAKPDRGVPPAPPLPIVVSPAAATARPRTLSVKDATRLIGGDAATCDHASSAVTPEAYRLDATHSLSLVAHPCGNGAYNGFASAYVLANRGDAVPAAFDAPMGMGEDNGTLVNAGWDATSRRLTTFAKGRGLGDCGTAQSFAWDGSRFRLVDQREMGECRGSIDYIVTWRARVVTR